MSDNQKKYINVSYFFKLVSAAINGKPPEEPPEGVDFNKIFQIAKLHSLGNTTFYAVEKLENKPEPALYKKWCDERNIGVHRNLIQTMEFEQIKRELQAKGIEYMPMKGLRMSGYYPKPEYRTMSDIDFLIREKNLKACGEILKSLGYKPYMVGSVHHDEYHKPPLMIAEFHHELIGQDSRFFSYYDGIMDRCEKVGDYEYRMSDEDFYIFTLVHLNKHYEFSGTGVRSILDMYLLNEKLLPLLDRTYVFAELDKLELREFFDKIREIGEKWFKTEDYSAFSEDEIYIIRSTSYGLDEHEFINRKGDLEGAAFLKKRIFPSYGWMKDHYPAVKKFPPILPFAYVYRLFHGLIFKRKRIKNEITTLKKNKKE